MLTLFAYRYLKSLFSTHPTPPNKLRRPSPSTSLRSGFFSHQAIKLDSASAELRPLIQPRIPGLFVPSLPSELWLLILKEATYPIYDPDYPSSLPPPYPYDYPYPTVYNPELDTVSFLDRCTANVHRLERLAAYKADIQIKANFTLVCRAWSVIAQDLLYEFVWISRGREGRALAERLCGDGASSMGPRAVISAGATDRETQSGRTGTLGRIWKSKGKHSPASLASSSTTVRRKSSSHSLAPLSVGRFIKRLHIETPPLDQCSPHDLLLILQHCPNLDEYCDFKGVRRPMHPLILSQSPVVPFSVSSTGLPRDGRLYHCQPPSPDALLDTLLSRPLKHLTWTNYDYDPMDYSEGLRLYQDFVAPRLSCVGASLEFLEIILSQTSTFGMGGRQGTGWAAGGTASVSVGASVVSFPPGNGREETYTSIPSSIVSKNPAASLYGAANMLTSLEATLTTTTTVSTSDLLHPTTSAAGDLTMSIDGFVYALCLPSLTSLKATLDNATFHVLSTWDMPLLTHLSILSADFSYAGAGFRHFFEVHGAKLFQLELGHSSGDIEEAWLTDPPRAAGPVDPHEGFRIPLDAWCPALNEFICSADAEWNWQTPDWIAPHVLLPSHSGVQLIGVRGMEKRLFNDLDNSLRRHPPPALSFDDDDDVDVDAIPRPAADNVYFALLQQFGSLLRKEAFPSLRFVRDLSWESDQLRRSCCISPLPASATLARRAPLPLERAHALHAYDPFGSHAPVPSWWGAVAQKREAEAEAARQAAREAEVRARMYGLLVNEFWGKVLKLCGRDVWLEDCRGENVTGAALQRARMI